MNEDTNEAVIKDDVSGFSEQSLMETVKVAPLTLDLAAQLGYEHLSIVIAKLNEVITFINK